MAIEGGDEAQHGSESTLVSMLVAQLAERDALIAKHRSSLAERDATIAEHRSSLAERDATIAKHRSSLAERDATIAERDAIVVEHQSTIAELQSDQERLRRLVEALKLELQLVKRRMFIAKAERVDTTSLQLELEDLVGKLDALSGLLPSEADAEPDADSSEPTARAAAAASNSPSRPKPKGRRNLADVDLPEERVEIADDLFEELVAQGKAERIDHETSYKLGFQRGGFIKLRIERVKYRAVGARGEVEIETAPMPPELLPRCLASASTLARIATQKMNDGMPLYRLQDILARDGATVDRGTMSRWLEQLGGSLGPTIIEAMDQDVRRNAFCVMTDATGFLIQPGPRDGPRRPCRRGHYFVRIADRDHILFDYSAKHDSATVRAMFKGYEGYLQADAATIYDVLFRPPDPDDPDSDGCTRIEVACWSHARRKYWEAALAKESVAREALVRIAKIFELDARFQKRNPPSKIKKLRNQHLRPLVQEFLDFAEAEYEQVKDQRSSLRSALGYTVRQAERTPLRRRSARGEPFASRTESAQHLRRTSARTAKGDPSSLPRLLGEQSAGPRPRGGELHRRDLRFGRRALSTAYRSGDRGFALGLSASSSASSSTASELLRGEELRRGQTDLGSRLGSAAASDRRRALLELAPSAAFRPEPSGALRAQWRVR